MRESSFGKLFAPTLTALLAIFGFAERRADACSGSVPAPCNCAAICTAATNNPASACGANIPALTTGTCLQPQLPFPEGTPPPPASCNGTVVECGAGVAMNGCTKAVACSCCCGNQPGCNATCSRSLSCFMSPSNATVATGNGSIDVTVPVAVRTDIVKDVCGLCPKSPLALDLKLTCPWEDSANQDPDDPAGYTTYEGSYPPPTTSLPSGQLTSVNVVFSIPWANIDENTPGIGGAELGKLLGGGCYLHGDAALPNAGVKTSCGGHSLYGGIPGGGAKSSVLGPNSVPSCTTAPAANTPIGLPLTIAPGVVIGTADARYTFGAISVNAQTKAFDGHPGLAYVKQDARHQVQFRIKNNSTNRNLIGHFRVASARANEKAGCPLANAPNLPYTFTVSGVTGDTFPVKANASGTCFELPQPGTSVRSCDTASGADVTVAPGAQQDIFVTAGVWAACTTPSASYVTVCFEGKSRVNGSVAQGDDVRSCATVTLVASASAKSGIDCTATNFLSGKAVLCYKDPNCIGGLGGGPEPVKEALGLDIVTLDAMAAIEKGLVGAALAPLDGASDSALLLRETRLEGALAKATGAEDASHENTIRFATFHAVPRDLVKDGRVHIEQVLALSALGKDARVEEVVYGRKPEPYREAGPAFALEGTYEHVTSRRVERHLVHQVAAYGGHAGGIASRTENVETTVLSGGRVKIAFDAVFAHELPSELTIVHELRVSERNSYEVACTGGGDEDGDGASDCDDTDCAEHPACSGAAEGSTPPTPANENPAHFGCEVGHHDDGDPIVSAGLCALVCLGISRSARRRRTRSDTSPRGPR